MELYHISLNNLRRRKLKMIFVLLGIVIGISTIVSVYTIVESMKMEMARQVSGFGVNVTITPDTGSLTFTYGGITLPEILYDVEQLTDGDLTALSEVPSKDMIKVVAPKLLGVQYIDNAHKVIVVGASLPQEFAVKPWMRLADESQGRDLNTMAMDDKVMEFESIDIARQDLERLQIEDDEIILGASIAHNISAAEGDTLNIGGSFFTVNGILLESGSVEDQQIFMNLQASQKLLNRPREITVIDMAVDYLAGSEEVLLAEIADKLPHASVTSLRQESLRRDDMLGRLVRFGVTISVIVLLVGMLVVGLTMTGAVRDRTREIGVFRAIGFRKSHIFQMIIIEGILISFIAGIIGYILGSATPYLVGPYFTGTDMTVELSFKLLFYAVGLAVLIGLVSCIYPAYKAAKQDPVEALRFI